MSLLANSGGTLAAIPSGMGMYSNNYAAVAQGATLAQGSSVGSSGQILAASGNPAAAAAPPVTRMQPIAASAGFMNNTFTVAPTVSCATPAACNLFTRLAAAQQTAGAGALVNANYRTYAASMEPAGQAGTGGVAVLADESREFDPEFQPGAQLASALSPAGAPDDDMEGMEGMDDNGHGTDAPPQPQRQPTALPVPVVTPTAANPLIAQVFPQPPPLTGVGTVMLQNASQFAGMMSPADAAPLYLASANTPTPFSPIWYATPVGPGMTSSCGCPSNGCSITPCGFGQPWRF